MYKGPSRMSTFFTYEIASHKGGGGGSKNVDSSHNFFPAKIKPLI